MPNVKLTIRVRDPENRVRVQESRNVPISHLKDAAQQMAHSIQRSFERANATRGAVS